MKGFSGFCRWVDCHARFLLAVCCVVGLVLRWAWIGWVQHVPTGEESQLLDIAQGLAQGKGFLRNGFPTAWRSIGYCLFLAIFYLIPEPLVGIHLVSALLSTSVCLVLYLIGREMQGPRVGLLAAALWAVFPTSIFASSLILDEHLCMPLMFLGLFFALRHLKTSRWSTLFLAGLFLGVAALTRPIPSVFSVAIFLCFWICRFSFWESLKRAALVAVVIFACAAPWAVRNWIRLGSPVLYCVSQYGFYWANNSSYDVRFPINPKPEEGEDPEVVRSREGFNVGGPAEITYARVASQKAWAWIRSNPSLFLKKTLGKTFHLLGFSEEEWAVFSNFSSRRAGAPEPHSFVSQWLLIKTQTWSYVLMFLGALGGIAIFLFQWLRRRLNFPFLLLTLAAGQVFVLTVLYLAAIKYRFMLDPFFLLGCCYYYTCACAWSNKETAAKRR